MASGLLSLKWNHHRSTFLHVLANIRQKESYCDVTLACDGKFYSAHKLVLSTCSEYFEGMFDRTQCKHPVIVLKDIGSEELEALLSYMYDGEVNVLQENLSSLIKAAECLKIKGLAVADHDPSEKPKDKSANSNKESNRSHSSSSNSNSNYHGDSSSSRQFRNSTSGVNNSGGGGGGSGGGGSGGGGGGLKRPNFSNKQDDSQPIKRRRPDQAPISIPSSPVSRPARSESSEPTKTPTPAPPPPAAVVATTPSRADGDDSNSIDATPAPPPNDDHASSDVPDDGRTFAQGLNDDTGVKAEPVEIIDSDDMGSFDHGNDDRHDASDAEFTEEKFTGQGGDDPNSLWGNAADASDLFSQPSTSAFADGDGTGNKSGGSSAPVPLSSQLSPVEAFWIMDLHRSSVNRQLFQHAEKSQSDLSSALLRFQQHRSPTSNDTANTNSFSSLLSSEVQTSSHELRSSSSSSDLLSVPRPAVRRDNSPPSYRRGNYLRVDLDPSNISANQLECPVCPYKASVNSRLREHLRQHTGERPYVCPVCSKGFGRKTHLDTHMVIHSGEKPFKCTICSYSATQKGNLKIHMQSHTGEKPHACNYCDYKAAQKLTLRLHIYNKHPEARGLHAA